MSRQPISSLSVSFIMRRDEHYLALLSILFQISKKNSKKKILETILLGYDIDNTDIYKINVSLQLATQNDVLQ